LIGTLALMAIGLNELVRAVERRFNALEELMPQGQRPDQANSGAGS